MSLRGVITTGYDPTILRDYLEKAVEVELTDILIGRNLCFKIFRFPQNAWSYTYRQRSYTRATVIEEFSAPPVVRVGVRKFGMEYHEIGVAVGITDRMLRFSDIPLMTEVTDAAIRAMALKQDRDVLNCGIASVPFYADGAKPIYVRLQNADLEQGEWKTFKLEDHVNNRCSRNRSHVIVGDGNDSTSQTGSGTYPEPPQVSSADANLALLQKAIILGMELIEEHPGGRATLFLFNPRQKSDIRNFLDFTGSNKPSIAPPQFNRVMTEGWVDEWMGIKMVANHCITPGTGLLIDESKYLILAEYSAPFIEQDIRDPWKAWSAATYRQYYQPACPNTDYGVLFLNLLGDLKADGATVIDHQEEADVDAQYTALPIAGGERAGVPG